jgi:hypothetical protein
MERLSPPELIILRVEDRGLPMHVAALIIFDGAVRAGLADSGRAGLAGPRDLARPASLLDLDTLRVIVAQRLHLAPRLRQVLYRPGLGLGPPVWVDAAGFDIREHVRARPVPAPGDEAALLRVCAELNQDRLDRSRPLWQMWLLTGLADHRAGLLVRLHHVVADGIAALAMLGALCDPDPGTAAADVPAWAIPGVPASSVISHLDEPRPHTGGWSLDRDGHGRGSNAAGDELTPGVGVLHLLVGGPPAIHPRAQDERVNGGG